MSTDQVEELASMMKKFLNFAKQCLQNKIIDEETYADITSRKIKFIEEIQTKQG